EALRDRAHVRYRHVAESAGQRLVAQAADPGNDPCVLGLAGGAKLIEIVEEDSIELRGSVALTGKALEPDPVGDQQMVQRTQHRLEKGAHIAAQLFLGQVAGRFIDALVGPGVVGRKHHEMLFHGFSFSVQSTEYQPYLTLKT